MKTCLYCSATIKSKWAKKFCNSSCAASFNNTGLRRHGNTKPCCLFCGLETKASNRKYCSIECTAKHKTFRTAEERARLNRLNFMNYHTKKKNQTPCDADPEKIKEIYLNCPPGYEVDHIIPISKGGLHHQDNLQYLTVFENRSKGNKLDWRTRRDSNPHNTV